ncbi:unnamed protein product [Brassica rapa subsp. narinosa]
MEYHLDIFKNVDVIVTPTTGYLLIIEIVYFFSAYLMRFVVAANLLGFLAISVPVGYDKEGLPIGLQIMGRPWAEATCSWLVLGSDFLPVSLYSICGV